MHFLLMKDICTEEIEVKSKGNGKIDSLPESNENVGVKLKEEVVMEAVNGDSLLISKAMLEEEEKLLEARAKEEVKSVTEEAPNLNDSQFNKLDELLTQTQLFSAFLLEKMDDITRVLFHMPFHDLFFFFALCNLFYVALKVLTSTSLLEWSGRGYRNHREKKGNRAWKKKKSCNIQQRKKVDTFLKFHFCG